MSFPRAKIQRFNDLAPSTPSPADYNVALKNTAKCTVIPQSDRFVCSSPSISENGSIQSTPCFRTPTLPIGRKYNTKPSSDTKPKGKGLFTQKSLDLEALKEKTVECDNKDVFIKELTEQLDDLKEKMCRLDQNILELSTKKSKCEEKISALNVEHETVKTTIRAAHAEELKAFTEEKSQLNETLMKLTKEYEELKTSNTITKQHLDIAEGELQSLGKKFTEMEEKYALKLETLEKEHMREINDIEFEMLRVMTELEKEKQTAANKIKEMENLMAREISNLNVNFQAERERFVAQCDAKIIQAEEALREASILSTKQMNEKICEIENWKHELEEQRQKSDAILKEFQTISEYHIMQSEIEKNEIKSDLAHKTTECECLQEKFDHVVEDYIDLNNKFEELQTKYNSVVVELNSHHALNDQLKETQEQLEQTLSETRAYQITTKSLKNTVEVLTKRLINSDKDVEHLNAELTAGEEKILEYESKCIQLTEDLKQAQQAVDELEMQYESSLKISENEIQEMKADLIKKVNEYKSKVDNYSKKLSDEKELFNEVLQQLHEQKQVNGDAFALVNAARNELQVLQEKLDEYEVKEQYWKSQEDLSISKRELEEELALKQEEITNLMKQRNQLEEKCDSYYQHFQYYKCKTGEYEKEVEDAGEIHKKYIEQSGKYDNLLQKYEQLTIENADYKNKLETVTNKLLNGEGAMDKYEELLAKYASLEKENNANKKLLEEQSCLFEPFKTQLEAYEMERETLLSQKNFMENEAKDLALKYAEILGNQNKKQKIKHLIDIKMKNEELLQVKCDLEAKQRIQLKAIEKLKKEIADIKRNSRKFKSAVEDKENIASPNRSQNSSRIESPGPFRERN